MNLRTAASLAAALICVFSTESFAADLSVKEAVLAAENFSPRLKAAKLRETQARDAVIIQEAGYYPTLDAQAIQGYGMLGANSLLGIGGPMGAPFRSGPAAGLVSQWNVFDPQIYYGVAVADDILKTAEAQTALVRYQVDQAVLAAYFDAARDQGLREVWRKVGGIMTGVAADVHGFVQSGQALIVKEWLVNYQVEDARMREAVYAKRAGLAIDRLAALTDLDADSISCPEPDALSRSDVSIFNPAQESQLVAQAMAQERTAHAEVALASSQNYPRLSALAGAGDMSQAVSAKKQDYSLGLGVTLPIFEGFRITKEAHRAREKASESDLNVAGARLDIAVSDKKLDESIEASQIALNALDEQLDLARKTFKLAKARYLLFQEPLVDVRESLRNLGRIESRRVNAKVDLLFSLSAKAALNGGTLRH
ncbi:MAG: TolC family protein [Elusimicrobiota bacterium]